MRRRLTKISTKKHHPPLSTLGRGLFNLKRDAKIFISVSAALLTGCVLFLGRKIVPSIYDPSKQRVTNGFSMAKRGPKTLG